VTDEGRGRPSWVTVAQLLLYAMVGVGFAVQAYRAL
jgi:hypothetical protein